MKTLVFLLAVLIGVNAASAQTPEKFTLRPGQQKVVHKSRIAIKFIAVTEESRCPEGVNCIWAGVAKLKIKVRKNGKTAEFELDTNQLDKPANFAGYEIRLLSLSPYPKSGSTIGADAYRATFTISAPPK